MKRYVVTERGSLALEWSQLGFGHLHYINSRHGQILARRMNTETTNRGDGNINQPIVEDYLGNSFQSRNTNAGMQQHHLMLHHRSTMLSLLIATVFHH